jgi:nucleoside-diphosphate-sugar epimerase
MRSDYHEPLNLGQDRLISINDHADLVANVAGISIVKKHVPGPQGVRGRNSDNSRLRQVLGWEPRISLEEGFARTYPWIEQNVADTLAGAVTTPPSYAASSGGHATARRPGRGD